MIFAKIPPRKRLLRGFRKTAAASLVAAASVISVPSQALIPVTDVANLIESIMANMQEMQNWMQESELMRGAMEQAGLLTEMEVDTVNNGFANLIARTGKLHEEIQNLELLREAMPAHNACEVVTASANLEDILCDLEDERNKANKKFQKRANTLGKEPGEASEHIEQEVRRLVDECRELGDDELGGDQPCLNAQLMLGGALSALTDEESKAAENLIQLVVEPVPKMPPDSRLGDDAESESTRALHMREIALKSLAHASMHHVLTERKSVDGQPSRMQLLKNFAEEHFGSHAGAEHLAILTNTHGDKRESAAKQSDPSQVLRSIATMDAFLVYMEVLKYEQQLRMEALQASLLSLAVEPLPE